MPYLLILYTDKDKITSPCIAPNNNKSKYGFEDKKIIKEIRITGSSMVRNIKEIVNWECKHI